MNGDIGHQMANYEKVLHKGLKGIREEVEYYQAQVDQPYDHYQVQQKKDFYKAVLISIDAAIAYAKRYSDLAKEMAAKKRTPSGKKNCCRSLKFVNGSRQIPHATGWKLYNPSGCCTSSSPANWPHLVHCFGRFDQYMYPFFKKSVTDDKTMNHDEALELLNASGSNVTAQCCAATNLSNC